MLDKLIFNSIAPLLLELRWIRSKLSLFRDKNEQLKILNLIPEFNLPGDRKQKILIGSIRSLAHSNLFEGGIGKSFKNAGYDVAVLRCGQFLEACETKPYFKDNQIACSMCHREFDYFKRVFDLEELSYKMIISTELKNEINDFINSINLTDFQKWKVYPLRKEWTDALFRYYLGTDTKITERPDIAKKFLYSVIVSFEVGKLLVNKFRFTHLFISHGIYSTWGGVVSGFKDAGGNVTVWGRGYYKSRIVSFKGESYLRGIKFIDRNYIQQRIDRKRINESKVYLDSKWTLTNNEDLQYYQSSQKKKESLLLKNDIDYIGFFPNIPWDGQAFVATEKFKNLRDVIEVLIRYIEEHANSHIIIRPHPAENPENYPKIEETFLDIAEEYQLEKRKSFTIIPYHSNITSYDIAEKVKVNVLFAGTIGVEIAAKGMNVVQLGRNVSSNKGLFYEVHNYDEFARTLDNILNSDIRTINKDIKQNALEWATFYYCQAHMEDPFFDYKGYSMVGVKDTIDTQKLSNYLSWVLNGDVLYHT